jgi:hypothetical protein
MDMRMLHKLVRLMGASTLSELEIREGGGMVRIRRDRMLATVPATAPVEAVNDTAEVVLSPLVGR